MDAAQADKDFNEAIAVDRTCDQARRDQENMRAGASRSIMSDLTSEELPRVLRIAVYTPHRAIVEGEP